MSEYTLERLAEEVNSKMEDTYDLVYVDYQDSLTPDQISYLISGDMEAFWDSTADWEHTSRYEGVTAELRGLTKDIIVSWNLSAESEEDVVAIADVEDVWELSEEWANCIEAIEERDSGEWLNTLVGNSGSVFVRIKLGEDFYPSERLNVTVDEVIEAVDLPDSPELREVIEEIIPEIGEGPWIPFLFGTLNVADYMKVYESQDTKVTLRGGSLLLENIWQGSGFDGALPEDHETVVTVDQIRSDKDQIGYAWDDVCGFVPGCYPLEIITR